jgi:hypothetical protein
MLYDKRWDRKTELEYCGITLSGFIGWLESMPADGWYDYSNPRRCATGQYWAHIGGSADHAPNSFDPDGHWLNDIVSPKPNTFGGALKRARRLQEALR